MSIITIINIFLLASLVSILFIGVILNHKYNEDNVYQKYLMATLMFWAVIMLFVYAKFFVNGAPTISYTKDVCSVQVLLLGIPCFISLVSYPVTILNTKFLTVKQWVKATMPTSIVIFVYFAYHLIAGLDPFVKYASLGELFANIGSISVILRMGLYATYMTYAVLNLCRIWKVVPLYNQYVQENIADSECNVWWIRRMILYIGGVMTTYTLLFFFSSPYINMIYIISLILLFFYVVEMSLLHHTSNKIEKLELLEDNDNRKYYSLARAIEPEPVVTHNNSEEMLTKIDKWIEENTPYTNIDFTTSDIIAAFPELTHHTLTALFRSRGITFQNYVRRFRIIKACQILDDDSGRTYSQQTFAMVGFSHHSSFSRSFVALLGISPSEYAKLSKVDKAVAASRL